MLKEFTFFFILQLFCLSANAQSDSSRQLKDVLIREKQEDNFGHLHKIDGMRLTGGKKSEVIYLENLTANKATNNTRQLYAKVAGLNIFENDGSGLQLSIGGRGLDPNRTSNFNVRQNGYDISADPLGYPESYYTPPADALERIEIVKGAASLQYGTQFGGLLNFKMKQPGGDKAFGLESKQTLGSWGFFSSYNAVNGTVGKFSYYGYALYKRGNGYRPNSKFESIDGYAALRYQVNEKHSLGIEYTQLNYLAQQPGGLDDRMFAMDEKQSNRSRNYFAVGWHLLNVHWDAQLSYRTKIQTLITGLNASRDAVGFRPNRPAQPDNGNSRDLLKGEFNHFTMESRLLHQYKIKNRQQTMLAGLRLYQGEGSSMQGNVNNGDGASFNFINEEAEVISNYRYPNTNMALFTEHLLQISDRLMLTPGLRLEYINTKSQGHFDTLVYDLRDVVIYRGRREEDRSNPRTFLIAGLGGNYRLNSKSELYGNVSQNYRSVTFSDLSITNASLEIDPAIKDEKGWSSDFGIRSMGEGILRYDINLFYLHYGNRIGEAFYAKQNGQVIRRRGNIGAANIYGLESLLELDILPLVGIKKENVALKTYSNLALTQAIYSKSPQKNIEGSRVEYVPVVNWKMGIQGQFHNWRASLQGSYLSDQFADATNAKDGGFSGVNGLVPAYYLLDFSASWSYKWLSVEASLNNLLDAKYFTRRATGYPGPGILPGDGRSVYLTMGLKL